MWKLTILLCFLPIVHPEILDKIYGVWTPVALFPIGSIPYCVEFSFAKDEGNIHCKCADGKDSTLVNIRTMGAHHFSDPVDSAPISGATTVEEVNSLLNVTCQCGETEHKSRGVIRYVNENYMIMYFISDSTEYSMKEPNNAQLMAKVLPTQSELLSDLKKIPELSQRKGGLICAKEVYDLYKIKD